MVINWEYLRTEYLVDYLDIKKRKRQEDKDSTYIMRNLIICCARPSSNIAIRMIKLRFWNVLYSEMAATPSGCDICLFYMWIHACRSFTVLPCTVETNTLTAVNPTAMMAVFTVPCKWGTNESAVDVYVTEWMMCVAHRRGVRNARNSFSQNTSREKMTWRAWVSLGG
jgi:hypothetical protein